MYIQHKFFCLKCGREGIPVYRAGNQLREKFHKKKLYCIYCKQEVNHIEIRNPKEEAEFKEKFENGEFADEETEFVDNDWFAW